MFPFLISNTGKICGIWQVISNTGSKISRTKNSVKKKKYLTFVILHSINVTVMYKNGYFYLLLFTFKQLVKIFKSVLFLWEQKST